jgi:cytochrome c peroxidase
MRRLVTAIGGTLLLILVSLYAQTPTPDQRYLVESARWIDSIDELPVGLGVLPKVRIPLENPQTPQKIRLGRELFFDKTLSGDRSMSCATCHDPAKGFSDGRPRARGFRGAELARHTPSILNAAYNTSQFWDGRAATLEEQAVIPISAAAEMGMLDQGELTARLDADPRYRQEFQTVFGEGPCLTNAAKAIAAFERTLITAASRFDRYAQGDKNALTLREKNGLILFIARGRCARCHDGPNFTDNNFHNTAVGDKDEGRFAVTGLPSDRGAFKTPGLRDLGRHAPYMHDGSLPTLEAVIDYYDRGGNNKQGKSPFIMSIGLSPDEKGDLLAFLKALNEPVVVAGPRPRKHAPKPVGFPTIPHDDAPQIKLTSTHFSDNSNP